MRGILRYDKSRGNERTHDRRRKGVSIVLHSPFSQTSVFMIVFLILLAGMPCFLLNAEIYGIKDNFTIMTQVVYELEIVNDPF